MTEHYARGFCGGCGELWPCPGHQQAQAEKSRAATTTEQPTDSLPDPKGQAKP